MEPLTLNLFWRLCKGQKAFAVYRSRNLGAGNIQKSRHNIPQLRNTVADRTGFQIWQYMLSGGDEQRNMTASFIWP